MLILKPAASNCFFSSGASLCTQRLELSASGMIAHTVLDLVLFAGLLLPLLADLPLSLLSLLPQPANTSAPAAASAAPAANLDLIICDVSSSRSRVTLSKGLESVSMRAPYWWRILLSSLCRNSVKSFRHGKVAA